jgi:hypothetical protein
VDTAGAAEAGAHSLPSISTDPHSPELLSTRPRLHNEGCRDGREGDLGPRYILGWHSRGGAMELRATGTILPLAARRFTQRLTGRVHKTVRRM